MLTRCCHFPVVLPWQEGPSEPRTSVSGLGRSLTVAALTMSLAIMTALLLAGPISAQQPIEMQETFDNKTMHRVSVRVELSGALTLPPEKDETTGKKLPVKGQSSIDYEERLLTIESDGKVKKSIRHYQRMDFERKVGEELQQGKLRSSVARLVILRKGHIEVPFSPDGPLLWSELDLVRTDVFVPALAGLLPDRAVRTGDRWAAATSAVQELTDFEKIEKGSLECRLENLTTLAGQRHARISFKGTIYGIGEDGRSKQQLDGYVYFNLDDNYLSYLSMHGVHAMLDMDGKEVGQVDGNFVLTRQKLTRSSRFNDSELARLTLEPNDDNTRLLHDNPDLGIRFVHSRRWRVAGVRGPQLGLDENGGSGILLTVEPLKNLPSGQQYLKESQQWLQKQKVNVVRIEPVRQVQRYPRQIENFALDVKTAKEQFRMYYFVVRDAEGGVLIAARLMNNDLANLQREVQRLALSIEVRKKK